MTQKLEDLFKSFTDMTAEEQMEKIQGVRDARSIERPAVAKRKRAKEAKSSEKKMDNARQMLMNLGEEERAAMIAKLTGG